MEIKTDLMGLTDMWVSENKERAHNNRMTARITASKYVMYGGVIAGCVACMMTDICIPLVIGSCLAMVTGFTTLTHYEGRLK